MCVCVSNNHKNYKNGTWFLFVICFHQLSIIIHLSHKTNINVLHERFVILFPNRIPL